MVVSATDEAGNVGLASLCVVRDAEPPLAHIDFPPDGHVTQEASVTMTDLASDPVGGRITEEDVVVEPLPSRACCPHRSSCA